MQLSDRQTVTATTRWSAQDRMGLEFAVPLTRDTSGRIGAAESRAEMTNRLLKAG